MIRELCTQLETFYETNASEPNTFRQTLTLKDPIDGEIFRKAVDETMKRYPYFQVILEMEGGKPVFRSNPKRVPVLHTCERTVLGSAQTDGHLLCFCYWDNNLHIDGDLLGTELGVHFEYRFTVDIDTSIRRAICFFVSPFLQRLTMYLLRRLLGRLTTSEVEDSLVTSLKMISATLSGINCLVFSKAGMT